MTFKVSSSDFFYEVIFAYLISIFPFPVSKFGPPEFSQLSSESALFLASAWVVAEALQKLMEVQIVSVVPIW